MTVLLKKSGHIIVVMLLVMAGSSMLVRSAPGYLSDAREMDPRFASTARVQLAAQAKQSSSLPRMLWTELRSALRGDFGRSREYDVPVRELITPRLGVTGWLLLRATGVAWTIAFCGALLANAGRGFSLSIHLPFTILLAIPTAAMATVCIVVGSGGPVLVMAAVLATRDFKFLNRLLRVTWREPHVLQARAQGIRPVRLLGTYVLPAIRPQLLALGTLSLITGLSAIVPVEVVFGVPGIGQLAWHAAVNRDLPVLLAVTILMAVAVSVSGTLADRPDTWNSV